MTDRQETQDEGVKLREAEEQLHPLLKVREQKYLY
jgi:hypothetical protein